MSLVTGTARTGEAAAVGEAPLLDGRPVILGTLAIMFACVSMNRLLAGQKVQTLGCFTVRYIGQHREALSGVRRSIVGPATLRSGSHRRRGAFVRSR